jgi:RimJ/RimL family protein N-acetyltransferase
MFEVVETQIDDAALHLSFHLNPWDEPFFHGKVAAISAIRLKDANAAVKPFERFRQWCAEQNVHLVSCKLPQDDLRECGFLEAQGFRFIELTLRPTRRGLGEFRADPALTIQPADPADAAELADIASRIFQTGRLHVDPQVDSSIGDRRYAAWVTRAFENPGQTVLKCLMCGRIIGFMVIEQPTPTSRLWSLFGIAPDMTGRGLGRRMWQSMMAHHHAEGVLEVSTSISSQNVAVLNLYAVLGFRFTAPSLTLHWCPVGPIAR